MLLCQLENKTYTADADDLIRPVQEHLYETMQTRVEYVSNASKQLHETWEKSATLVRSHAELINELCGVVEAEEPGAAAREKEVHRPMTDRRRF
jgi:hypothetical protein